MRLSAVVNAHAQGTGQLTAACARVYDFTKDPWELFGVLCLGVR